MTARVRIRPVRLRLLVGVAGIALVAVGCTGGAGSPVPTISSPSSTLASSAPTLSSSGPTRASPPPATAAPSNSPSSLSASPRLDWTSVTDLSAFDAATVTDVTSYRSGFVAVGNVSRDGATNGAIWASPDGSTWQSVPVAAPLLSFMRLGHVGDGLVATGSECAGTGECIGISFWSSADGSTWVRHDSNPCCWIVALATAGFAVVGVGTDWSNFGHDAETDVAAYVSRDGSSWTRSAEDPSFMLASMGAVAAGGPGVIALGNGPSSLIAWTSSDGMTWSTSGPAGALGSGEARDMVARGSTVVAVGRDPSGAVGWTSLDGKTWSRTPTGVGTFAGAVMERLAVTPAQVVAVGKNESGAGAIWTSADGHDWSIVPGVPGGSIELNAVAASGSTVVAFGSTSKRSVVVLRGQPSS